MNDLMDAPDTVQEEKIRKIKDEIRAYEPPEVLIGQPVSYYWQASANTRKPNLAWVVGKFENIVDLFVLSDIGGPQYREAVRHMSDPKLKLNIEQRENGGWDYTEHEKTRMATQAQLDDRLRALEIAIVSPVKSNREVLLFQAKHLGLKNYHKLKSEDLQKLIFDEMRRRGEDVLEEGED